MNTHRVTSTYSEAFEAFLKSTDEKAILLQILSGRLRALGISSLLDIGAGDGYLAIPLAAVAKRYLALEQKEDYVRRLRGAGLEVIQGTFPCTIEERFDAVLLSHAMPPHSDGKAAWEPFVAAAWSQVNHDGHLLLVTFEDQKSEWNDLLESAGLSRGAPSENRIGLLNEYLQSRGKVRRNTITTYLRTQMLQGMMEALAFVWSDGKPELMEAFMSSEAVAMRLNEKYRRESGYWFPFRHYLIDVCR